MHTKRMQKREPHQLHPHPSKQIQGQEQDQENGRDSPFPHQSPATTSLPSFSSSTSLYLPLPSASAPVLPFPVPRLPGTLSPDPSSPHKRKQHDMQHHQQHVFPKRQHPRQDKQHVPLYQHIQEGYARHSVPHERHALTIQQLCGKDGAPKLTPRSPDPGYMDAIGSYFAQSYFDRSEATGHHCGNDSHSDDEQEVKANQQVQEDNHQHSQDSAHIVAQNYTSTLSRRDTTRKERRRSRSVCDLSFSSAETPLCSPIASQTNLLICPANDRPITTPPSSTCPPYAFRRHNSCVAPNTKEFKTLATIFGWVNLSMPDASPHSPDRKPGSHLEQNSQLDAHLSSRSVSFEGDRDSDIGRGFRHDAMMQWTPSLASRDPEMTEITESCLQSPAQESRYSKDSIELLAGFDDLGLKTISQQHSDLQRFLQCRLQHDNRGIVDKSSLHTIDVETTGGRSRTFISSWDILQTPCVLDTISPDAQLDCDSSDTKALLSTSQEYSLQHQSGESSNETLRTFSQHGMNHLSSPLFFNRGQDSGYLSLSCNLQSLSVAPSTTPRQDDESDGILLSPTSLGVAEESTHGKVDSIQPTHQASQMKPQIQPPIPPRCPGMDTSDFDHPDKEGPDTIVYAPLRAPQHDSLSGACEVRPIIAATINKLIEKLTHQHGMDSGFMADFFLTYRLFMSPVQLCKDLIRRYLWALEEDTESRCVVRVRTFVVFRYWINNHFTDDFLTSQSLRFQMGSFLNGMCFNPRIQASARDSRIIRNLAGLFKQHRKYYKDLAERILARERQVERQQSDGEEVEGHPNATTANTVGVGEPTLQAEDVEASSIDVESLGGSTDQRDALVEQWPEGVTNSDACSVPMTRIKGRNRALTLAGTTTRSMIAEAQRYQSSSKPSLTRESRVSTMSRQTSEGGTVITRERRLSASSIKSSKGGSTWSSKMTMGINKLRQKSEDIYQQLIHPATVAFKHGDSRSCLCWTPEYTGITEHHALSTARSYPCLRPSVIVTSVPAPQDLTPFSQPSSAAVSSSTALAMTSTGPSNRSIKRLKSPINLNPSSSTAVTSPGPSPTRNQFSSLSSRHSRSNSNSSMSYHPNPNCPYHVPCQSTVNEDAIPKQSQEAADEEDTLATLKEALQDAFVEMAESLIRQEQHEQEQQQQPAVPSLPTTIPPSPAWGYYPFYAMMQHSNNSSAAATPSAPLYKPFILYYRSQMIAQQLCLLEQHFLEQVRWDELLELELARAGRKNKGRSPPSISGYRFKAESERNGIEASNERSNRLCMWVASEIVSTPAIEDRVRVIEKFIRIAQKCYQYRNYNSLIQLVMGLGSWQLCGLRRTWSKVSSFEMRVLQELQDFISPCSNWKVIRKAMNQASDQKAAPTMEAGQRLSMQGLDNMLGASNSLATESTCSATHSINDPPNSNNSNGHANTSASVHSSKYLHHPLPLDKQGCIPFLGLFVFDLTHIAVSPSWYLPQAPIDSSENQYQDNGYDYVLNDFAGTGCSGGSSTSVPPTPMGVSQLAMAAQLQAPEPKDLQELLPTGTLLVHFHRFQLIAKTIKWFLAFQRNSQRYTFSVDSTLYSKCFLLRVLSENRIRELAQSYEQECVPP